MFNPNVCAGVSSCEHPKPAGMQRICYILGFAVTSLEMEELVDFKERHFGLVGSSPNASFIYSRLQHDHSDRKNRGRQRQDLLHKKQ